MCMKKNQKHRTHRKPHRKPHSKTHKKTHSVTNKTARCAPSLNTKPYTCYSSNSLHKLKHYWNKRHPDVLIHTNDTKEIWNALKHNLSNVCNSESCWLKQRFIKNKLDTNLLSYTFAPKSPKIWKENPNEWLTSVDITNIMKQYEKTYPCFEFIGPSPIDYDTHKLYGECVWEELCNFSLNEYIKKGKRKIGIIFNLDPHYKGGSHWVALFININKKFIFYFDSNGDKIPKRIKRLVGTITTQGATIGINFKFYQNHPKEHQRTDTECGMYSLYFTIQLLKDSKSPSFFKEHRIPDEDMEELRKKYFN
jgi:hypothetical protein